MSGAGPDDDRARGIDIVRARERERQSRERRAAPAHRRAASVRAEGAFDGSFDLGGEACDQIVEPAGDAVGAPVEDQARIAEVAHGTSMLPRAAAKRGGGDEHSCAAPSGSRRASERHDLDGVESLVGSGRLELAQGAHLRCRRHDACLAARELPQLVRPGKRAVAIEQPLDQVDLRLGERRVEPDAARRQRMADRGVDDMAA